MQAICFTACETNVPTPSFGPPLSGEELSAKTRTSSSRPSLRRSLGEPPSSQYHLDRYNDGGRRRVRQLAICGHPLGGGGHDPVRPDGIRLRFFAHHRDYIRPT